MKNIYKFSWMLCLGAIAFTACQEDNEAEASTDFTGISGSAVSVLRGTTATVSVDVFASSESATLTANGSAVSIGSDGTASVDIDIPAGDVVGTTYDVNWVLTSGSSTDEFTSSVTLVAGGTEPLVTTFGNFTSIEVDHLLSSTDILSTGDGSGTFQLAGSADGAGMVVNPTTGNFELLVNCEDHYSVARVTLDQNLTVLHADYLLNSSVADFARQCSGTMWEAAIHGGSSDMFISSSESFNFVSRGIDPFLTNIDPDGDYNLDALGQFAWENNVPLPQGTYAGRTVIIGGDDDSSGSEGQVALYYSAAGDADFTGGNIYVLKIAGATSVMTEEDLNFGQEYDVEFVQIPNGASLTKNEMEDASVAALSLQFMRVEDLDYGKGSDEAGRTIFFAVTGRGPGRGTYNDWGTGYKLVLDANSPLTGKLTQVLSGNTTGINNGDGNAPLLQSPDNIVVTENYVYWQEDPNSFSRNHQAYIWQTDWDGNNLTEVLQIDYNLALDQIDGNLDSDGLNGEFGAMFDISDKVGEDGTFILALQPHYWRDDTYSGIDGHDLGIPPGFPGEDNQGSQLVILRNVPR